MGYNEGQPELHIRFCLNKTKTNPLFDRAGVYLGGKSLARVQSLPLKTITDARI